MDFGSEFDSSLISVKNSLGKEIQLKSISDGVVFCHSIIPKGPHFRIPQNHHRMSRFTTHHAKKQNTGCKVKANDRKTFRPRI